MLFPLYNSLTKDFKSYNSTEPIHEIVIAFDVETCRFIYPNCPENKALHQPYLLHATVAWSDDRTEDVHVQLYDFEIQKQYSNIHLLVEAEKTGLGGAYIKAMQYCSTNLGADIVFEFDSDGSHQPTYIPEMLAHFHQGADVVMGSRYVPGGSIPRNWAWNRKLL